MRDTHCQLAAIMLGFLVAASGCDSFTTSERHIVREAARRLPEEICVKGSLYLDCMSANWEGCMETAIDAVEGFLARYREHPTTTRPKPGQTWKDAIREYVQGRFEFYYMAFPVPWKPRTEQCKHYEEQKEEAIDQAGREREAREREQLEQEAHEREQRGEHGPSEPQPRPPAYADDTDAR